MALEPGPTPVPQMLHPSPFPLPFHCSVHKGHARFFAGHQGHTQAPGGDLNCVNRYFQSRVLGNCAWEWTRSWEGHSSLLLRVREGLLEDWPFEFGLCWMSRNLKGRVRENEACQAEGAVWQDFPGNAWRNRLLKVCREAG